jgi:hypothetical protein
MLKKSMFIDDGIIKMLKALYSQSVSLVVSCNDVTSVSVCTDNGFWGGWEVRVVLLTMLFEVIDGIGAPRGDLSIRS